MGKIYSPPSSIPQPEFDWRDMQGGQAAERAYVDAVIAYAKKQGSGALAGEQVSFGVADGYATYIVLSTSPLALIHLPIGDAYQYPYIHRLTVKDIKARIQSDKAIRTLFQSKAE